jgi:hypothetical protein
MKKIFFLSGLCLICILTHAQQIDTTLLYGRWQFYSSASAGGAMCRDSIDQNIKAVMPQLKAMREKKGFTSADSLTMIGVIKDVFETYFTFDKGGHFTAQAAVNKDPFKGGPLIETGTYQCLGENKIFIDLRSKPMTYAILKLTETILVIKAEGYDVVDKGGETTFTRVK